MTRNGKTDTPDGSGSGGETKTGSDDTPESEHLSDVPEGCGCVEVWEHLSEERESEE